MAKRKPVVKWELQVRGDVARSQVQLIRHEKGISSCAMNGYRTGDTIDEIIALLQPVGVKIVDQRCP